MLRSVKGECECGEWVEPPIFFLGEVTNPRLTCFITLQWLYPSILVMINLNPSILVMINNLTLLYWS